ncbi:UDP-2,3-diacylglucosamine diphosphatase LpxI [bacterium]|nr:UDP-2,3-diacylglucosamine diphosphatase LpxI [bacterium]
MKKARPTLGLIAGAGDLPSEAARSARRQGYRVIAAALAEANARIAATLADRVETLSIGKAGALIDLFRGEGVTDVVIVGKVDKSLNFANLEFDEAALAILSRLASRADMAIGHALIDELTDQGFAVRAQTDFLDTLVAPKGAIAGTLANERGTDVVAGLRVARALTELDVGQTVVVRAGAVIAVEAFEHTDATIRRAGRLAHGDLVVVKLARPDQDMRFDVPAVGVKTLRVMADAGADALAIEAGKTLVLDKPRFARLAERLGIAVVGVARDDEEIAPCEPAAS